MAFWSWSRTAASNATADTTINFAEGQSPSSLNDSNRSMMARLADWRDDISGTITTGGTAAAYSLTSNQGFDTLAHMSGAMVAFIPHATNTGTCTLNVDGLGAKALRSAPSVELAAGVLVQGAPYVATYVNADSAFYLQGFIGNQLINWVAAGGTSDVITATYAPAVTVLVDGLLCFFRASAANTTTTPTFAPNGLTAHTITRSGGVALSVSDIPANLAEVILRYNAANTRWELLNPATTTHPTAATRQVLTSGTGATYTRPAGCTQIRVRAVGGGGGGGGTSTGSGAGANGNATTFNSVVANGGTGGGNTPGGAAGAGGAGGTGGTGTASFRVPGNGGCGGAPNCGGAGGGGPFGGGAPGPGNSAAGIAGTNGGGGSGASSGGGSNGAGGGACGEFLEFIITNPSATYTYTVAASAAGGVGAITGGAGGAGLIIVDETYF